MRMIYFQFLMPNRKWRTVHSWLLGHYYKLLILLLLLLLVLVLLLVVLLLVVEGSKKDILPIVGTFISISCSLTILPIFIFSPEQIKDNDYYSSNLVQFMCFPETAAARGAPRHDQRSFGQSTNTTTSTYVRMYVSVL